MNIYLESFKSPGGGEARFPPNPPCSCSPRMKLRKCRILAKFLFYLLPYYHIAKAKGATPPLKCLHIANFGNYWKFGLEKQFPQIISTL